MKPKLARTPEQEAWLFQQEQLEKQKIPKGQSCKTCDHCHIWQYQRNIFYCAITKCSRTQNGMAKTKARAWCKDWKEGKPS